MLDVRHRIKCLVEVMDQRSDSSARGQTQVLEVMGQRSESSARGQNQVLGVMGQNQVLEVRCQGQGSVSGPGGQSDDKVTKTGKATIEGFFER